MDRVQASALVFNAAYPCTVHPETTLHPKIISTLCLEGHYQQPCNHLPGCNTAKAITTSLGDDYRFVKTCWSTLWQFWLCLTSEITFSGQLLRISVIRPLNNNLSQGLELLNHFMKLSLMDFSSCNNVINYLFYGLLLRFQPCLYFVTLLLMLLPSFFICLKHLTVFSVRLLL